MRRLLRSRWLIPALVTALSATMTAAVWLRLQHVEVEERQADLTREIALISVEIRDRLRSNTQILRGVRAFFGTTPVIQPEQWQTYTQQLGIEHDAPGLLTYGLAQRIGNTDAGTTVAAIQRTQQRPDFSITPPPALSESFAVIHLAPAAKRGVGADLYSTPGIRKAIELARDIDEPVLSGRTTTPIDDTQQPVLTLLMPVYASGSATRRVPERRRDITGVAFTTFRITDFMGSLNAVHNSALGLRIFDDESFNSDHEGQGLTLLFDSFAESSGNAGAVEEREIEFGQRKWLLQFQPKARLPALRESTLLLGGGLAISFLLGLLTWNLSTRRQRAEAYAKNANFELQQAEERFQLAAQGTNDGLWDHDFGSSQLYVSARLEALLGYPPHSMPGSAKFLLSRIHPDDLQAVRNATIRHIKEHARYDIEYRMLKADNHWGWFRSSGQAVWNASGRAVRMVGSVADITERKRAEGELLRHRDHLRELVAEQTADLLAAKETAESASAAKSEFLANMSHEMRTPMHAVLSFAGLGEEKARTEHAEKLQHYFHRIRQSGERLLRLLNDLLDLSKLEAGKMLLQPKLHDVRLLIHEAAEEFESLLSSRQLHLVIGDADCGSEAMCDPARFGQVIRNLLSNAIKFSPDAGQITVTFAHGEQLLGRRADEKKSLPVLRITIADEGVGIPPNELESIFEKFVQSSKTKSGAGGTGLGLAICHEIMAAHRGTIQACNNHGRGASFIVQLPIAPVLFPKSVP